MKCAHGLIVIHVNIFFLPVCTTEVEKVCKVSEEENLQPFKDKMEKFLARGNWKTTNILLLYWVNLHQLVHV